MKKIISLFLLTTVSSGVIFAQRLLTEDFNYNSGQLTGFNGGANVSGGRWTHISGIKPLLVAAGNLAYKQYITNPSANSGRVLMDTTVLSAEAAYISFDTLKQNTVYISFLLNVDSTGNLIAHDSASADFFAGLFTDDSVDAYGGRVYIRKGALANTYNLGIAAQPYTSTPISWINNDLATDTTHLITLAYQIVPGPGRDIVKLWVDPPNVSSEPAAQASSVFIIRGGKDVTHFALRQHYDDSLRAGTPKCQIDAIKISTSWSDGTLPLLLKSFYVVNNDGYASLNWETANEQNVKNFEVQKSLDARNFSTIGNIAARNSSSAFYSYNDAKLLTGTAYYKIKITDEDGAASYSAIVSVNGKIPVRIGVFPNPVINNLVLIHPKAGSNRSLQIVMLDGRPLLSRNIQNGAVQTSIDVSKFSKGSYLVIFTNGNEKQSLKFIKE